ncbi:MAG: PDZ domain-containing protein [Planctomycetes bacterium]|nr:PDZ domain-containing protein [Planctomycetota bacterium]
MMKHQKVMILAAALLLVGASSLLAQDLNDQLEKATKEAARKVAPSVVQIVTLGGTDIVVTGAKGATFRKALGPTTGLIVGTDGYIISSSFNFINSPTTILVAIPGRKDPVPAKRIATDKSRMLTLLKVDANSLPVPAFVPNKDIIEGQWAIALGRTLDSKRAHPPSVSLGIISAVGRIWGKAIQTDAKVSPVNYGGPLIDMEGRVQGILIPASPTGADDTAGFEWYDSGIGFAIPMEDVLAVLPRLKEGKDLQKGTLGIGMKTPDLYSVLPEIGKVAKDSAAARAGLKPGDVITEVDGKPVIRMAQIMHILGTKYEGEKISLKYKRGDKVLEAANLELVSIAAVTAPPFLGILPMRDDPKLGVEIRYVFAKGPAEAAGLKVGDRIVKYGTGAADTAFTGDVAGRAQLLNWLNTLAPGTEIRLEVARKDGGKSDTVAAKLETLPGAMIGQDWVVPDKLPAVASLKRALEPLESSNPNVKPAKVDPAKVDPAKVDPAKVDPAKVDADAKKVETGLIKRNTPDGDHKFWVFVHEKYDPNVAHALVVWLHPPGKNKEEDVEKFIDRIWEDLCQEHNIILIGPASENETGWLPSDADYVLAAVQDTMKRYTIDRQRVVAHGLGVGGQMAIHLGFNHRDVIRGVAAVGAVVTQVKDTLAAQRLCFFLAGGALDPIVKTIAESRDKLVERKFSAMFREMPERGREYLDETPQLRELARWIETLDKQ